MPELVTLHGFECWYKHIFEKVGWIILAKKNGNTARVANYVQMLDHFLEDANLRQFKNPDSVDDMKIMKDNVTILKNFITPYLLKGGAKKSSRKSSVRKSSKKSYKIKKL
jgi:hypothetical protein